jgi:hypothetical protein
MSNRKNPLFEKDIRHKVAEQKYIDESGELPKITKNPPFFQFYKGASFDYMKEKMNENPKAMNVWFELVTLMDNQGAVMISQPALADFFGVTRQTVNNWIKWLDENELISIFKVGTANVYAINASIVSDRLVTQKQEFALFNARVVADKKEQTKKVKKKFFSVADVIAESEGIHPNQSYLDIDESGEMIVKQRM